MRTSGLFHGELDHHPIPSFAEQIELGRAIRRWLDHPGGEAEAPLKVRKAGKRALDRLVSGNVRLVLAMAAGYFSRAPRRIEESDLVSVGIEGLIRAARKFDPERGYRFSTYATWWIRQAMQREARAGGLIRTPDNIGEIAVKAKAISGRMMATTGHEPTLEELAKEVGGGVTPEKVKLALTAWQMSTPQSANIKIGATDKVELLEAFGTECDGWESIERQDNITAVRLAMSQLGSEQQAILRSIYYEGKTLRAVAKEIGLTPEAARLRLRKARAHLQRQLQIQRR